MAKVPANLTRVWVDEFALSGFINATSLKFKQETPVTTAFADAGPRRVAANYDWDESISGGNDFASGAVDATLFALVGSAGVASAFDPTGTTAAADHPNYDGTVVLGDYGISCKSGGRAEFSASLLGASALSRAVA